MAITALAGGSGPGGNFAPGDRMTVTFTLKKDDGSDWDLEEMNQARLVASGPTFNYQRVIAEERNVKDTATEVGDGTFQYTLLAPIPAAYLPPLNDGPDYGPDDGELTGQPLLDGTYTVSMAFRWDYTVEGRSFRDVGNVSADFLLGASVMLSPREVVRTDGCNRCHENLQFHGGLRREATQCLMCHTAGMESSGAPNSVLGRQENLDFQVMIHRIHSGNALPSVQGVTTTSTGQRDYTVAPAAYKYSDVEFPSWPTLWSPMPRDTGYAALMASNKAKEDAIRSGPTSCYLCHGDPDGSGPLPPPTQGDLIYDQPSRRSCTSCHDDWIPTLPYESNMQVMFAQLSDAACKICHTATGSNLAVMDGHLHPLRDPVFAKGIRIDITGITDIDGDLDGTVDQGETPEVQFTVQDDAMADVVPGTLGAMDLAVSGPTENSQLLLSARLPLTRLTGPQPFRTTLPEKVFLEYVGDAGSSPGSFTTLRAPHWDLSGAETVVTSRSGTGGFSTLSGAVTAPTNFVDVISSAPFARNDFVVIDDGLAVREYLQIQWVEGNRLWFSSPASSSYAPGPVKDHPPGAVVSVVTLEFESPGTDYTLVASSGTITETTGFGNGRAVVVGYVTDFRMPMVHQLALNAGSDLDERDGGWAGKDVLDRTYTLSMWANRSLTLPLWGETNTYREGSTDAALEFVVGPTGTSRPYDLIDSADGCYRCHVDLQFHGNNRRGFSACLACHGTAASGDRPRYVAENAPATDGVTINFREMVHKIHRGSDLDMPYTIVGFGLGWPDNYSEHTYDEVAFPTHPSRTKNCGTCHGSQNTAWLEPFERGHPSQQGNPVKNWTIVCGACHDSSAAQAHIEANTGPTSGAESCSICHGQGKSEAVDIKHMIR